MGPGDGVVMAGEVVEIIMIIMRTIITVDATTTPKENLEITMSTTINPKTKN